MRFRLTTTKVLTSVIALVVVIFIAIVALLVRQTLQAKTTAAALAHSQEVLFQTTKVLATITDNETGSRGFVISGNPDFLQPMEASKKIIYNQIASLKELTKNSFPQQQRIDSLSAYVIKRLQFSDSAVYLRKQKGLQPAIELVAAGTGKLYMDNIRQLLSVMQNEETITLQQKKIANEKATTLLDWIMFTVIIISLFLIIFFVRKGRSRIATQKKVEEALKKNEEHFHLLWNNIKDYALFMLDANGTVLSWSSGAEYIKGYNPSEVIGKSFTMFYTAEDIKKGVPQRNLEMAKRYGHYQCEGWRLRKDGSAFWADVIYTALKDENGNLYGYSKITRDVTEKRKVQQELEFLSMQINQANDSIYIVDAQLKIKSWNKGAENLYGFTKEEVLNKDPNTVLQTDMSSEELDLALKEIAEKEYWTGELRRVKKNGTPIHVYSSTTAIRNGKGETTGYVAVSFDITEQKKLQEQVKHLANMVEESSEAIFSRGLDQRIISWNKGAEKLFGYTKEEAIGRYTWELNYTQSTPERVAAIEQQILTKGTWKSEREFFHTNGSSVFCSVTGNVIKNENGEATAFYFIVKDISTRKQMEEQLKQNNEELEEKVKSRTEEIYNSEKRYRYLFESNPLPMWVIDLKTFKFLDVNEMATLQYGYSREEFLSMTAVDIRPDEEKELFIKADHSRESSRANYNRGIWKHRKKDGTIITVEIIGHEILFEGAPARFILSNDITEKKKAEEKLIASEAQFHRALDSMLEGVQIHDFDWKYLYVNDSLVKYSKYPREELLGHTIMEKFPGIEQSALFKTMQHCMKNRVAEHLESEFVFPDGSKGYFELSLQPVPEGIFILSFDITERKQAEEGIKKLNAELEERVQKRTEDLKKANEELEAFSYSVSHDLRAPLRAIIGYSAILEEDYSSKLDDEAKRITGVIKSNTSRMGALIDDLLSFSRMGRHEITKVWIHSEEMVHDVIKGMGSNSTGKINWSVQRLPVVKADNNLLKQVWINLISNAVKYSARSDAPQISIGAFKKDGQTVFFIKDNGVGFDEKYKAKLFKVFQRLHSSEEFEGTGIGLAIVEKVISKHGGSVWAEAEVNKGATFYFSLPDD